MLLISHPAFQTKTVRPQGAEDWPPATGNGLQPFSVRAMPPSSFARGWFGDGVWPRPGHKVQWKEKSQCHPKATDGGVMKEIPLVDRQKHDLPRVIEKVSKIIEYTLKGLLIWITVCDGPQPS